VWNGTAWVPQAGTAVTGGTAPATPAAGQVWVDTSGAAPVTKIWDGTKWVTMTVDTGTQAKIDAQVASVWKRAGTVVSPANAGDQVHTATGKLTVGGTAAAPAVSLDPGTTGSPLVRDSNGRVGIGTTPSEKLHVAGNLYVAGGNIYIDTANMITTSNVFPLRFGIGAGEKARIDASGRLLVGTSTARSNFFNATVSALSQVEEVGGGTACYSAITNVASATGPAFIFGKTRGTSAGSNTAVVADDGIGTLSFQGSDGTEFVEAATIRAFVDGTPGANDMPGRLVFSVTPDSKATPEEAMRIKNSKIINFANAPTYADNTTAKAGGLVAGDVYKKADGTLMITF